MQKGHIFRRGPSWFVRFREPATDGGWREVCKRIAPYEHPFRSKRAVEKFAHAHLHGVNSGTTKPESTQRLCDFVENCYLPEIEKRLAPSSVKDYRQVWEDHIQPALGDTRLRDVTPNTVQVLLQNLANEKALSHRTLRKVRDVISGMFTCARVTHNMSDVLYGLKGVRFGGKRSTREMGVYTLAEIQIMLRVLPEPAKTVVAVAAFTGLSRSELRGLNWEDFTGDELRVQRTVWNTIVRDAGKTEARLAKVPVISVLRRVLEAQRRRSSGEWIFQGAKLRRPLNLENLKNRVMLPVLQESGIQWKGWHAFRRGLATNLYQLGVAPKVIQSLLRHANVDTTMEFYVKPPAAEAVAAMRRLERAYANSVEQTVERRKSKNAKSTHKH